MCSGDCSWRRTWHRGTGSWLRAIGDNVDYTHVCLRTHFWVRLRRLPAGIPRGSSTRTRTERVSTRVLEFVVLSVDDNLRGDRG